MVHFHDAGRPEVVYGMPCRDDQLEHSVLITEAEMLLGTLKRDAPVGQTTADGLLVIGGVRFYVEVDNETMSPKQMREKWSRYGDVQGFILVICKTKGRMRRLMQSAEQVKDFALFTRFRWLRAKNVKRPWLDCYGKRSGI
jgi:hypothetical protein